MEIKELRKKSKSELTKLLQEAGGELVKLRADRKTGSLADGSAIKKKRAEIARASTVLKEQEILDAVTKAADAAKAVKEPTIRERKRIGVKKLSSEGKKDARKKT